MGGVCRYLFEHTELSIYFESFNDECAIVREAKDANLLSQESKLTRVNLQLNLCPSKSTTPVLKRMPFSIPYSKFTTMNFLGQAGQTMACYNNYLADILRVCVISDIFEARPSLHNTNVNVNLRERGKRGGLGAGK